jgi:hypothetical protein
VHRKGEGMSTSAAVRARAQALIAPLSARPDPDIRQRWQRKAFTLTGWAQDSSGIWMVGHETSLLMRLQNKPACPLRLVADVRAAVAERHPTLDVIVLANGQSLGRWTFTAWTASGLAWDAAETEEVEIPAPVVAGSPDLLVQFTVVNPRSPMSMNLTPETRPFGMHLRRLRIG